jgi:hypothetical protein
MYGHGMFTATIILPAFCMHVECGIILCAEHRLRVFKTRVLRRIFGLMEEE